MMPALLSHQTHSYDVYIRLCGDTQITKFETVKEQKLARNSKNIMISEQNMPVYPASLARPWRGICLCASCYTQAHHIFLIIHSLERHSSQQPSISRGIRYDRKFANC